ncbi:MAG: hypothetical protein MSIBF_03850 [Candidatus Altiarchaeales archaeon IMC4]|nr:MAG: hypothetical protein MSIBF_03850 [Candidatus Altiarchaeales archaeon IMC4]
MEIEAYLRGDYTRGIVAQGKRADGRKFDEFRKIEIETGYVGSKAEGSAFVNLGGTKVLAGVKMDIGTPFPDRPDEGVMTVNSELRPMASPNFELGPPNEDSVELARVVDRGIRESGTIDTKKLSIQTDDGASKVWVVFVDMHVIDNCGNLIDAAGIAALSSLLDARMPRFEGGAIVRGEWEGKLPVTCAPVPCTFAKIGSQLVLDPTIDEEYAMNARLTVTTTDTINAMQKGGSGTLTEDDIKTAVDMAFKKSEDIRRLIKG